MKNRKAKKLCIGLLCVAMISAGLTGCGEESSESYTQVMGRVTAVSDSEITLAVFEKPEGKGVSGGAVHGQDRPEGSPPAGDKQKDNPSTETKTIAITKSTKVYTQQGEEKTEVSLSDVQLGSMVSVELDGEEAVSITLQTMNGRGGMVQRDGSEQKRDAGVQSSSGVSQSNSNN